MERVGLIQMTSGPDPVSNMAFIERHVGELKEQGASWVVTPENSLVFGSKVEYHSFAEPLNNGPLQTQLCAIARNYHVWLLVGSFPVRRGEIVTTTSLLIDPHGLLVEHYDKLHMFDVEVEDQHKSYRESEIFSAGDRVVVAKTPFAQLGLTICYDVRFPHLYSELVQQGAQIIVVPAAFTAVTGEAHWETLLRARAIESQVWIVAVNQAGTHPCGRETWGHSMVIDPWGKIVSQLNQDAGHLIVNIELEQINSIRKAMPIEQHRRFATIFKDNKSEL